MFRRRLVGALVLAFIGTTGLAYGNWTASGTFRYVDREYDQTGFTGAEPSLPIRFANVEVRDANASGGQALLATGATDASGNFTIAVSDNKTRTVYVRAVTASTAVPTLFLKVQTRIFQQSLYSVASPNVPNHSPATNVNFGTVDAAIGAGGEAFNIYDNALRAIDFIAALNGSRPGSSELLILEWEPPQGGTFSSYNVATNKISVGDPSAYSDTVLTHECGHYAYHLVTGSDNPGGVHHLLDCGQDLRLAYDEGRATWFGQSVRRFFNLSHPEIYMKSTGGPGPGNLDFYFNVETETPYYCDGAASEVAVYSALWDIDDSASTADGTPGVDDDTLARPDADNWDVDKNYISTALNKSLEDFWDGWFTRGKGFKPEMIAAFQRTNVEYYTDTSEPNNTIATAFPVSAMETIRHMTYFADVNGDSIGEADPDFLSFSATAGRQYTVETLNLWGKPNTSLELLASNGITVLASNDDRAAGDKSSLIVYTPGTSETLYVRSFHAPDLGIYGSYDLRVAGNPFPDVDIDGFTSNIDCNDNNPAIHPGAAEVCNGVDDNCIGGVDEGFNQDADGFTTCAGDCNDGNAAIYPGAPQICDGLNDDCTHPSWPALAGTNEVDNDGDSFSGCQGDCNDANNSIWAAPGEALNLLFLDSVGLTLNWAAPLSLGGAAVVYDTLRSSNPNDFVAAASCVESNDGADTTAPDAATPPLDEVFFYVVRAENTCPAGNGSLGTNSAGNPRAGRTCP